jgi:flagella basal body P-ring formation protein FlgA
MGKAMEDGKAGDMIKVRNIDSQRVVLARVAADGTVEPLLNEVKK